MRLGLLGLGRIGAFHAETLTSLPTVDSLVVSDPVPALVEEVAGRLGTQVADTPEALLASGVDGVVIAAPTDLHPEFILLCVAAGIPVFCEKPVARDSALAAELARRVADAGVQVQIGYPRRFDPAFATARAAVADGDLGMVHTVRSTTLDPAPPPRAYLAASGGIFRDCAVHDFDAVRWVTGQEVTEVYAAGTNQDAEWFGELGDVHTASAVLTFGRRRARGRLQQPVQHAWPRRAAGSARHQGQHGGRAGTGASAAVGRAGRVVPGWQAVHILHGPASRGVSRRTDGVHRGSGRPTRITLHGPGCGRDRLGSRGLHAVAARAPPGPDRGSPDPMISCPPGLFPPKRRPMASPCQRAARHR